MASSVDVQQATAGKLGPELARQGLDAVIVHPTGILGPHDYAPSHAGRAMLDIYHGRTRVLVAGGFNWVDVRDVCAGAMAAAERLDDASALVRGAAGRKARRASSP